MTRRARARGGAGDAGPLRLTLFRHAKASRDDPALDDFDRPLTGRGRRDARRLARWIVAALPPPDCVLVSPARRTRRTAKALRRAGGFRRGQARQDHALYLAPSARLVARLRLFAHGRHVLLVGHNDGLSDLAAWLVRGGTESLPTAGVIHLELSIDDWTDLRAGCATVVARAWPARDDDPDAALVP